MASMTSVSENHGHPNPTPCRHHWIIQPATGPLSPGVCQVCGEAREFKNSVGEHVWDDYNPVRAGLDKLAMALKGNRDDETPGDDGE